MSSTRQPPQCVVPGLDDAAGSFAIALFSDQPYGPVLVTTLLLVGLGRTIR
jgi:hypothetical protein